MASGYIGRLLRINLTDGSVAVEERDDLYHRTYLGGSGVIAEILLRELDGGIDPLGPENKLIFANGVLTGIPLSGSGRNGIGAKSPLTGGFGQSDVGGFWGPELKRAGYDTIVVEGRADKPVYIWIQDGEAQIRPAGRLWGSTTGECEAGIRAEVGSPSAQVASIGPAGERLIRYACVLNGTRHVAGRTGLGAVMGSKNLKAVAVRGSQALPVADPEGVRAHAKWLAGIYMQTHQDYRDYGTASLVTRLNLAGALPTRNFQEGSFEGYEKLTGEAMTNTILTGTATCFACPIRCKRVVKAEAPYAVDPLYGGPQYETVAAFGSNCGVDDLIAVAKAGELCNAYGLDSISCGGAVAFAMECYERGLLTRADTDGLELNFGNAPAMVELVERICRREGLGQLLGEGVMRAAQAIGKGAERYANHVKGQELPMHEPRLKRGLGLGYAVSTTGAEHSANIQDTMFAKRGGPLQDLKALGVLDPLPPTSLGAEKVRMFIYVSTWEHVLNCLGMCQIQPYSYQQVTEIVNAATGWNATVWELMKAGERAINLSRAFNGREGLTAKDDYLPARLFTPFESGPLAGVAVKAEELQTALRVYYGMMGWDKETGLPTAEKLQELGVGWAGDSMAV